ncbi:MAG: TIR domain-containing protein [Chitinophagaceae bacterium]|nr:TIR domain-containing protein [Chitinophagaceae bacterium]
MENSLPTQINWKELLKDISSGNVIPVIGNEVYKFLLNDSLTGIDNYLSGKLLKDNDLASLKPLTFAEVVDFLSKQKDLTVREVNGKLKEAVDEMNFKFPIIESFLSIDQLFFYLNTTVYSSIFEKNIKAERNLSPTSINFSIRSKFKDCDDLEALTKPLVFNVFGSFESPDPALTEEEMLEFTTSFKERMNMYASSLLENLKEKSLLFLGCTHPDWLLRFFLRVLSNERINDWMDRPSQIIAVNDPSDYREKQYEFFKNYNVHTYPGNVSEFVEELASKWRNLNPDRVKQKLVFLSYNQDDTQAVENLKSAIESIKNVTCWYDKEKLYSGDNFDLVIIDNIRKADLFIPLISDHSLNKQDKYVVDEWFKADTVNKMREIDGKTDKYLMPILIDNSDLNHSLVKKFYPNLSIERVPDGNPTQDFLNRVKATLNLI